MSVIKKMISLTKYDDKSQVFSKLHYYRRNNLFIPIHIDELERDGISLFVSIENGKILAMTKTFFNDDEKEFDNWQEEIRKKSSRGHRGELI